MVHEGPRVRKVLTRSMARGVKPRIEKWVMLNSHHAASPSCYALSLWIHLDPLLRSILSYSTDKLRPNATWKSDLMLIIELVIAKDTIDINATVGKDFVLKVFGIVPEGHLFSISFPPVVNPSASAIGLCGADKDRRVVIRDVRGQPEGLVREGSARRFDLWTQAFLEDFTWGFSVPMN